MPEKSLFLVVEATKSLYNNSFGYGVYKRNQVNIGNPYKVKIPTQIRPQSEEDYDEPISEADDFDPTDPSDKELLISQDIIYKAKEEAVLIRHEAELEAERLLEEANTKAELYAAELEQKAREEGYQQGEMLAQQNYNDIIAEAQAYKERCKAEYEETLASLEQDMVNLVLNIAAKVVGDEIHNNREAILGVVREAIHTCSNHEHVILKVSHEDYEVIVENEEKLKSMIKDLDVLEIKKEGTLTKGSCIIDTGLGSVDGSVDTRLDLIRQAFFELLQNV